MVKKMILLVSVAVLLVANTTFGCESMIGIGILSLTGKFAHAQPIIKIPGYVVILSNKNFGLDITPSDKNDHSKCYYNSPTDNSMPPPYDIVLNKMDDTGKIIDVIKFKSSDIPVPRPGSESDITDFTVTSTTSPKYVATGSCKVSDFEENDYSRYEVEFHTVKPA